MGIPNRKRKKRLKVEEVGKKIKEKGKGRLEPDALVRIFLLKKDFLLKKKEVRSCYCSKKTIRGEGSVLACIGCWSQCFFGFSVHL